MLRIGIKLLLVTLIFIISCLIYNGLSFKPITSVQKTSSTDLLTLLPMIQGYAPLVK